MGAVVILHDGGKRGVRAATRGEGGKAAEALEAPRPNGGNANPRECDDHDTTQDHVPPGEDEMQPAGIGGRSRLGGFGCRRGFARCLLGSNAFLNERCGEYDWEPQDQHHHREARLIVESWRMEYNTERPHGALGGETPAAYAAGLEQENREAA
jgi:putative transposase